jgi:hypothetical protein
MKRFLIYILLFLTSAYCIGQIITNNGAKVDIKSGTRVMFHTLHNMGTNGAFNYNTDLTVPGNWINDSPAEFQHGATGTVTLNGTSQQTVKSSGQDFGDLTINNTSGNNQAVVLSDNMLVSIKLNLTQGIVYTGTNKLIFQANATASTAGNSNSFVDGEMDKIATGPISFTFPTGDVNLRDIGAGIITYKVWSPLKVNPVGATTVNVKYLYDNVGMPDWWEHGGNMDESLHHVSDREYWLVSSTQNFSTTTLYWNDNDHPSPAGPCIHGFDYGNEADFSAGDLTVAYWNGSMWIDAGGSVTGNHDAGSITSSSAIPFGAKSSTFITYGSYKNENPLPVELLFLTAQCSGDQVEVIWQTASEINNRGFVIEKSIDFDSFNQIGFVQGAGNSNSILSYSFVDYEPVVGNNYYRLKQIDSDGGFKYTDIVVASCSDNEFATPVFDVYPNPTKEMINISGENLPGENAIVSIYNIIGSLIWQTTESTVSGIAFIRFDMTGLPPAMYVVKIISGDFVAVKKVEKQ